MIKKDELNIGLQLYFLDERVEEDLSNLLQEISGIGYDGIEFAGSNYGGLSSDELNKIADQFDFAYINNHFNLDNLKSFQQEIDFAKKIGMNYLTIPILLPEEREDLFSIQSKGDFYRQLAEMCQDKGIQLCYHNHGFDLEKINDKYLLDHFILAADQKVKLELDNFFIMKRGIELFNFLEERKEWIELLHLKGINHDNQPVAIGEGRVNLKNLIKFARESNIKWLVVDLEADSNTTLEDAKISIDNIKDVL